MRYRLKLKKADFKILVVKTINNISKITLKAGFKHIKIFSKISKIIFKL